MNQLADDFMERLDRGELCLHPTDTVPGMTFHPELPSASKFLLDFKGYEKHRPFVSLVGSFEKALTFFERLPTDWEEKLKGLWPGPLTVVWKASPAVPRVLLGENGTVALRVPKLDPCHEWLGEVLSRIQFPLPSTSVNYRGEPPAKTWQEASVILGEFEHSYIPPQAAFQDFEERKPSALIELQKDGAYRVLRGGELVKNLEDR